MQRQQYKKRTRSDNFKPQPIQRSLPSPRYAPRPKALKLEVKTVDTACSMNFDNNSAVASCMQLVNTIPTGTLTTQRIGKRVSLKALQIRGVVNAGSSQANYHVTLILVWIKTPNQSATLPAATDILVTQSSLALNNRNNASKFKIVRRWDFKTQGSTSTSNSGNEIQNIDEYVTFKQGKFQSCWTGTSTAGTIAEFEQGALILFSVGPAANDTTTPTFVGNTRVYFEDA